MTERQFIEKFTKKEIVQAIFDVQKIKFDDIIDKICFELYNRKIRYLLKKSENYNQRENSKVGLEQFLENMAEEDRIRDEINNWMKAYKEINLVEGRE